MWGREEASCATLVRLTEAAHVAQAQGLAVERPATALRHAQRAIAVLHTTLILSLSGQTKREREDGKELLHD